MLSFSILIADDDAGVRSSLIETLSERLPGSKFETAENAADARRRIRERSRANRPFDVTILDIEMSESAENLDYILANLEADVEAESPDTRAWVLSGNLENKDFQEIRDALKRKPFAKNAGESDMIREILVFLYTKNLRHHINLLTNGYDADFERRRGGAMSLAMALVDARYDIAFCWRQLPEAQKELVRQHFTVDDRSDIVSVHLN